MEGVRQFRTGRGHERGSSTVPTNDGVNAGATYQVNE